MAGKGFKQFLGTEGEVEQGARTPALPPPPATYSRDPRSKHTKGGGSWPQHRPASRGSRSLHPHCTQVSQARGHLPYLGCKLALLVERG